MDMCIVRNAKGTTASQWIVHTTNQLIGARKTNVLSLHGMLTILQCAAESAIKKKMVWIYGFNFVHLIIDFIWFDELFD
jgi:hypothetical protein